MILAGKNLPNVAGANGMPGPCSAYCSLLLLNKTEQAPDEGLSSRRPAGTPCKVFPSSASPTWNAQIEMRKAVEPGARLLITVWHSGGPGSASGDLKLGRIEIELPPQQNTPLWYTIADDTGVVVQGSGGGNGASEVLVPPPPRTNRTRRVLHPVLIRHAAFFAAY